jgi:hypothetical protein
MNTTRWFSKSWLGLSLILTINLSLPAVSPAASQDVYAPVNADYKIRIKVDPSEKDEDPHTFEVTAWVIGNFVPGSGANATLKLTQATDQQCVISARVKDGQHNKSVFYFNVTPKVAGLNLLLKVVCTDQPSIGYNVVTVDPGTKTVTVSVKPKRNRSPLTVSTPIGIGRK